MDTDAIDALRTSVGDDNEFIAEIITTFLDDSPTQLAQLRSATAQGDAVEVRRVAHTLKSNAATFGLVELTPVCRELESRAAGGDLTGAGELVDAIDRALTEGQAALRAVAAEAGA